MYPILLSTVVLLKIEPLDGFLHVDDNFMARRFSSNPRRIFSRNLLIARIVLRGNTPNQLTNGLRAEQQRRQKLRENKRNKNSERAADNFCQVSSPSLHD